MENPRLVCMQRPHTYPLPELRQPKNTEEKELVFISEMEKIDDLIDDSLRFIDEELSKIGLAPEHAAELKERLYCGLLSVWARDRMQGLLDDRDIFLENEVRAAEEYFRARFGREEQFGPPLSQRWRK